jgi:hypothetical protein
MAVARVTEIIAAGPSLEKAIEAGIERANETLKNVKSAWIKDQTAVVEDGRITEYRVGLKVTFVLED